MIDYKSNKFLVKNEQEFNNLCVYWGLEFIAPYAPDERVSFGGRLKTGLTSEFWSSLYKCVKANWAVVTLESELSLADFKTNVHLLNTKGEHSFFTQVSLKYKESIPEKKRRRYLGLPKLKEIEIIEKNIKSRPVKVKEAKQ